MSYHIYLKSKSSLHKLQFSGIYFVCDYNDESLETKAKICWQQSNKLVKWH